MKIDNRKFVYLISPNKISKDFYNQLDIVLKSKKISFFQLRLKNYNFKKKLNIGVKLKKICKKNNVLFIINDDVLLAKKLGADGCHLGQKDMKIQEARKIIGNKIIGITCHNSIRLVNKATKEKANYVALGAFYSTKTKKTRFKANISILRKVKKFAKVPVIAIGGIKLENYKKLLLNKADFLAISSYIWNNKKLKPIEAIKLIK